MEMDKGFVPEIDTLGFISNHRKDEVRCVIVHEQQFAFLTSGLIFF